MKIKIFGFILCSFLIFSGFSFNCQPTFVADYKSEDFLSTSAKAMVLIEPNTKRVLFQNDMNVKLPMASTTKIMTALCVLKHCNNLDEEFEIDPRAVGIEGTSMYLQKGERLSVRDLLYGMILPSGNDASCALAYRISGSIEEFSNLMNEEAKKLNLKNSNFENPHGLDSKNHYTSAYDLAVITSEAMKFSVFNEIISSTSAKVKGAGGNQGEIRYLKNKNRLLNVFEGCTGVKTGFTDNAGRCFVSSSKRGDFALICVVLNCGPMFEECARIMEKGFNDYDYVEILEPYSFYRKIKVENGKKNEVKLWTKKGFKYPIKKDEAMKISYEYDIKDILSAPLKKEEIVGQLTVKMGEEKLFQTEIYTIDAVESNQILDNIKQIGDNWSNGRNL